VSPDASPTPGRPRSAACISTAGGTGGFKATPASGWSAHTVAPAIPHALNRRIPDRLRPARASTSTARLPWPTDAPGPLPWWGPKRTRRVRAARPARPPRRSDALSDAEWVETFPCDNPKGPWRELGPHAGCRRWSRHARHPDQRVLG
jgi:hypothetical protein